ncbi:hypothetical protein KY290_012894 [Solanum tuberosum]|uniref:Retrotransposon gag domain-containing protein n=1 Tax=Solanum tuberosum TaxID=4113 RepID=A0ABQ7VM20_SOLTU|nr:hypothetical protein KY285_012647 [Solanum tuberosum]KAH0768913.1 hypothetical protein KY290_012894 [Solanum tuberosum]
MYQRCLVGDCHTKWIDWIPWAKFCYNTSCHSTLHASPFQVVYGHEPPQLQSYMVGSSTFKDFVSGDVYIHNAKKILAGRVYHKLALKYYGPFAVLKRIESVAYQLGLPAGCKKLHDVFHESLLNPFKCSMSYLLRTLVGRQRIISNLAFQTSSLRTSFFSRKGAMLLMRLTGNNITGINRTYVISKDSCHRKPLFKRVDVISKQDGFYQVTEIRNFLKQVPRDLEGTCLPNNTPESRCEFSKCKAEFIRYLKIQDSILSQKARVKWFNEGEASTAYFHATIKDKRRRLTIRRIQDENNNCLEGNEAIAEGVVHFYQNLFTHEPSTNDYSALSCIESCISDDDNNMINASLSLQEVTDTVFSTDTNSSPGLDGLSDDNILFCNGNKRSMRMVLNTLATYEKILGQLINKNKSCFLMSTKTKLVTINKMKRITGMRYQQFPIKYLGCPLTTGRKKIELYSDIVNKVVKIMVIKITGQHGRAFATPTQRRRVHPITTSWNKGNSHIWKDICDIKEEMERYVVWNIGQSRNSNKSKGKSKAVEFDFPVHRPVTRSFSKNPNNLVPEPNTMDDEINSRFQEERVITEKLMDSKLAAMERLGEKIVQAIQEQFSSLGIGSTKLTVHGAETSSAPTTGRLTNPAPRGNTLQIQPADQNHQTSGNSNSTIPRYARMDFPTYDGTNNPLIWAHRCEQFFENQHTADAEKVGVAGFHLLGEAQLWYYQLKRAKGPMSWEDFKKRCFQRFGPPESSNPVGELVTLRQTGTVEIYQRQFQEKLARADELIPEHLHVGIFIAGLDDSIKLDIQLLKPTDLSTAMSIARALEKKQQLQRVSNTRKAAWQQSRTSHGSTVNSAKSNTGLVGSSTSMNIQTSNQTPFFKQLTRVEMAERRAKGLCYNCDEQYSATDQCKRLFWLELDDSVDDAIPEVPDDCPEISLHAITGQRHAQTMQLPALINRHHMLSLIDSGSTHNFISFTAASRLLLDVFSLHNIRISIANGEKVHAWGSAQG